MEKLNVVLIKPPYEVFEITAPLGLGYIAGAIRDIVNVKIINANKEKYNINQIVEKIKYFDVIGFQCFTVEFNVVKEIIAKAKKVYPNKIFVIGGPHPTLDPTNTLKESAADYVFVGEAEKSFSKFLKCIIEKNLKSNLENIPGIAYRIKDTIKINKKDVIENLDDYQIAWDLFDLKNYPLAPHGLFFKQAPVAQILATRGCPFNCTFCGGPKVLGHKIRRHSIGFLMKQIDILVNDYNIKEIQIEDDNFTMSKDYVMEFCNNLIKKNYKINLNCPNGVRLDSLDRELLMKMKEVGFYTFNAGIESGSEKIRKDMKKNLSIKTIEEKINLINSCGMDGMGFFIIGYPTETIEDINKTIDLACRLKIKRAAFSLFCPFPGTEIYDDLVKEGRLKTLDYEKCSYENAFQISPTLNEKALLKLRRNAYLRFYINPWRMYKMLIDISSFQNFKHVAKRIFIFFRHIVQ